MSENKKPHNDGNAPEDAQKQPPTSKGVGENSSVAGSKHISNSAKRQRCNEETLKSPPKGLRVVYTPRLLKDKAETAPGAPVTRSVSANDPKDSTAPSHLSEETIALILSKHEQIVARQNVLEETVNKIYKARVAFDPVRTCRESVSLKISPDQSSIQLDMITDTSSKSSNHNMMQEVVRVLSTTWHNLRSMTENSVNMAIREDRKAFERRFSEFIDKHLQECSFRVTEDTEKCRANQTGRLYGDQIWLAMSPQGELRVNLTKKQATATGHKILGQEDVTRLFQLITEENEKKVAATQTGQDVCGNRVGVPVIQIDDEIDGPVNMSKMPGNTMEIDGT